MSIMQHVSRRVQRRSVRRGVTRAANRLVAAQRRYAGGSPAEADSHRELRGRLRHELRAAVFGGVGRRIDLLALLGQCREIDYRRVPVWALVDPRRPIGEGNSSTAPGDSSGYPRVHYDAGPGRYHYCITVGGVPVPFAAAAVARDRVPEYQRVQVVGIPALPPQVRAILADPRLKHASMVGLLYQPDEWQQVRPDPALVVEWRDRPGEYYALAAWGHDGPRIMEFVD